MSPKTAPPPTPRERENAYEAPRFEPTGLDTDVAFDMLAETVRDKRGAGPIPDHLRPLIDTAIEELRSTLSLDDTDIARTLMVAASLLNQLIGRGPNWTRIVLMNLLLNIAEQMWGETDGGAQADDETKTECADAEH
jgi:hypothetical protein